VGSWWLSGLKVLISKSETFLFEKWLRETGLTVQLSLDTHPVRH